MSDLQPVGSATERTDGRFHVDRPFLYVIHYAEHRAPLFVGRVLDPTA